MNPRLYISFFSLILAIIAATISFYFDNDIKSALLIIAAVFVFSFFLFYYLVEKIIYKKIKLIYKLIYNLKMDKDLKSAIGEYVSDDPLNDVEQQVKDWARDKKTEIENLQKVAKYRKEFLANISHEFKTPLFTIQGYIQSLLDDDLEDKVLIKKFLEKADKNIERLSILVTDLDEISKLESGQIKINETTFEVSNLVNEIIDSFAERLKNSQIKISFKKEGLFKTTVYADVHKIRQVFNNLIDNAIKYAKVGGNIKITCFEMDDRILVEVTDDGIGIAEQHLSRVFERFYRTDASRSRQIGGSGLGLAIVKHIIEAHHQTINVRSTEGIGTTFAFTLPIAKKKIS
jgi:two-component system, OmpR family, phosphate regulon sensor histidine kinase PhoR